MLSRDQSILIAFGALLVLVVAITAGAMKYAFSENPLIATVMAICVAAIGFIGLKQEMLKGIFLAAYPPMVVSIRFTEGAIVGAKTPSHLRFWHGILFLALVAGLYFILKSLPDEKLVKIQYGWAVLGILLASLLWTRTIADGLPSQGFFCLIGVFIVFASTLAYVSASPLERVLYKWALPFGLLIGIVCRTFPHHD